MRRHPLAAAGLVLFLVTGLGALPTFAGPLRRPPSPRTEAVWTWTAVWDAVKQFASLLKNGSGIDPFGQQQGSTTTPPPSTSGDNGSGIDPFGGK